MLRAVREWMLAADVPSTAALFGRNGCGKSRLLGVLCVERAALVGFESTLSFVRNHGARSVADCCGGLHRASTRALLARFGLMHCWTRKVEYLSTGELRKLMLALAISEKPQVLLLDGAHDGLDPSSRGRLTTLLDRISKGFPPLLVSLGGVSAQLNDQDATKRTRGTQILQVTQRCEDVPLSTCQWFFMRSAREVSFLEQQFGEFAAERDENLERTISENLGLQTRAGLPDDTIRREALNVLKDSARGDGGKRLGAPELVAFEKMNLPLGAGGFQDFSWTVSAGQHWVLIGANGSGKTTLSRLISSPKPFCQDETIAEAASLGEKSPREKAFIGANVETAIRFGGTTLRKEAYGRIPKLVGVASISSHMFALLALENAGSVSGLDVAVSGLRGAACAGISGMNALQKSLLKPPSEGEIFTVLSAMDLLGVNRGMLSKEFRQLSLGQQRMVLLARSIVHSPQLLIWDEVCQGLDPVNRELVTSALGFLTRETNLGILNITHHADEVSQASTHFLRLEDRGLSKTSGPIVSIDEVKATMRTI